MDNQYLAFWQNTMSDIFSTDKQTEKINGLINETFSQFESITSIINSFTNTSKSKKSNYFLQPFETYGDYYKHSIKQFLDIFGFISIDEYRDLINRYEKLKKEKQAIENKKKQHVKNNSDIIKSIDSKKEEIISNKAQLKGLKTKLSKEKEHVKDLRNEIAANKKTIATLEKKLSTNSSERN